MKTLYLILTLVFMLNTNMVKSQNSKTHLNNYWQFGLGIGELPIGGSFKPSVSFGYHFSEKIYAGFIYQFKDKITRNEASFNAKSSGLDGLIKSSEKVNQRFLFQVRYTPIYNGPYISTGIVFNGEDTETMLFDERHRQILNENYNGAIAIQQTRPAGWGFALGLGYQYNLKNGFSAGFEWTPAWGQYPDPLYQFSRSSTLTINAKEKITTKMDEGFKNSVTNMYKVFHIGVAYRFQN